ncbi:ParA family protein [Nakamurella antarctica]|uniref:ParA family protein n=1 Tax=Nakamurella antarctica TaxID=1902245 RepID=A0A3G8ZLK5_9ACTN|nr:ParA family protein [Nakamurella antarctica]AZI57657.1 ParA family protein [Nakamurella antarctica]
MLVASVLSLKGGVGKTTVTLGLASAARQRGISTVVVDLDPQSNATTTLEPQGFEATIADVLGNPTVAVMALAIRPSAWGESVRVLAGSEAAERHNNPDPSRTRLNRLRIGVGRIYPAPDLVLIDCPPSLGQLTRNGLVASDRAILVTEPALYAVTGVQRALEAVHDERVRSNPGLRPLGVVVNRARTRSVEQEYRYTELKDLFGPLVLSPNLPDRSAIQQAQGAGIPIHDWPTAGAREVAAVFDTLLDRLLRSASRAT